jgi:hypothetical protein
MNKSQDPHWNTPGRASVKACFTQQERADASDKLRAQGFKRLYYFETPSGMFCVEGLKDGEKHIEVKDEEEFLL